MRPAAPRRPRARAVRTSTPRLRVGILGGTFDPPHFGHLALAEWARTQLRLDQVWFIPAGQPPHKRAAGTSAAAHRLAMTRLAVRGNPAFRVSSLETRRRGPSYTADTVGTLAAKSPHARLHLLMGADMFATFANWREPAAIARHAVLVVALRPGVRRRYPTPRVKRARVVWLDNPGLEVSSSALRARARAGKGWRYLAPDSVARYATRHDLYRRGVPRAAARG